MRRRVCTGLPARVCGPPPVVLLPARGPALPPPGVEAPAGGGLRRARAPGAGEAAANGGARVREAHTGRAGHGDTYRSGRAERPHPGAPAARQDGPGRRSHREGESARLPSRPAPSDCPCERSLASSGRSPGTPAPPDAPARPPPLSPAASPSSPFSPPPSPRPHQNGKYLPGRGAAGARLSEGQPTVTNSRRGSGGAGFLVANPKACR